jgi:hypothetical protein
VTEVDVPKTVTVQNVTFSDLVSIEKVLKNMEGVVEVKKSLKDNIGTLQVYCNRSTDDLAAQLSEKNNGFSLEITAFSEGNIEAKAVK